MPGPLPPYAQLTDFLPEAELQALLDWVLATAERFAPATISDKQRGGRFVVDSDFRTASTLRDLGPLEQGLRERLLAALPAVMAETGTSGPEPRSLELELAAHGDGAHYRAHVDLPIGAGRKPLGANPGEDRVLSAVLYFHAEPKAFSGGELRLYRFGAGQAGTGDDPADHVDIQPLQNSLVVFPSWARHEVRRVSCPSGEFRDHRFALNCWYCRVLGPDARAGENGAAGED